MIQEITLTKRVQTPTPPNAWCYQNQGDNYYRYFTDRVLLGHDAEPWPECVHEYRVGYELLREIRRIDHTEEELETLQAQYDAWKEANPDLVEDIENEIPERPEQEQEESAES